MKSDESCIFCKILSGAIPAQKVMEDEFSLAFLDINPLAKGHALLIPKGHFVTVDEMPAQAAGEMLKNLPALVRAVKKVTACQGVNVLQNNGRVAHQLVQHVHFHIIPRNENDDFRFNWPAGSYPPGEAEALAQAIRKSIV
ncbi:MAG: HIT family protein [Planctomycetes bacterium]|jgi:histidine triad (HIT) family protein|nr:HIT family protein [Planctomycetota bacterium]